MLLTEFHLIQRCIGQPEKGAWKQGDWKKHILFDYPEADIKDVVCSLCFGPCYNFTVTKAAGKSTGQLLHLKFTCFFFSITFN